MRKDPFWVRQARARQTDSHTDPDRVPRHPDRNPGLGPSREPAPEQTVIRHTGPQNKGPQRGRKGGPCNRGVCRRPGATWFNRGNYKFYCQECAMLINRNNPDMFGGRMCVDLEAEAAEIAAAHPMETGRHDLYAEAMRLVGERHAKGDLVELVNWRLWREERLRAALERIAKSTKVAHGTDDYPMDRVQTIRIAREALQAHEAQQAGEARGGKE